MGFNSGFKGLIYGINNITAVLVADDDIRYIHLETT